MSKRFQNRYIQGLEPMDAFELALTRAGMERVCHGEEILVEGLCDGADGG